MASGSPASLLSVIIPFALVTPILFLRMRRISRGTRVSVGRTIVFSVIIVGISVFLIVSSFYIAGVSPTYSFVYATIFVAVAYASYQYSNRLLDFWRLADDGSIYVKGGTTIFIFYIACLIARLALNLVIGGSGNSFIGSPSLGSTQTDVLTPAYSSNATLAATIIDGILISGVALLVGRSARILQRYHRIMKGKDVVREYK